MILLSPGSGVLCTQALVQSGQVALFSCMYVMSLALRLTVKASRSVSICTEIRDAGLCFLLYDSIFAYLYLNKCINRDCVSCCTIAYLHTCT